MKKLFVLLFLAMLVLGLASCDDEPAHIHSFVVKSTESKYLKTTADCENAATYYYSCACGEKGTSTFTSGSANGHRDANDNSLCDKCNEPYTDEIDITVSPTSISFDNAVASIEVGDTIALNVIFTPSNTTEKELTWISSDNSIVMVTDGVVLGIKPGSATIIAMTTNGKTATCLVNVLPKTYYAESITLNKSKLELAIGYSGTLSATVLPNHTTDKSVIWTSSNPSIVKVENGVITALSAGTATITATTSNGKKATCTVKSLFIPATDIIINEQLIYVDAGENKTVNATTVPENATVTDLVWSSSNTKIATVSDGRITGVSDGIAVITVKTAGGTIEKSFNVVVENSAGILYTKSGSGYSVQGLTEAKETIIIPDTYKGEPVVSISSGSFDSTSYVIKKLYIGKNVTNIPQGFLKNCTTLQELVVVNASTNSSSSNYYGKLFGTVGISWEGGVDDFLPCDTVAGALTGVGGVIYQIPAQYTDWILNDYYLDGWFTVGGTDVFVPDTRVAYSDVISWQRTTNGIDYYNVPKKVNFTAYYIPRSLTVVCVDDKAKNYIKTSNVTTCVANVENLKIHLNNTATDAAIINAISNEDRDKLMMLGTHELTVYYGGYITTVSVTVIECTGAAAVQENYKDSTCTKTGSYDSVICCYSCNKELSRVSKTIDAKGHSPKTSVEENRVEATCTEDGHYDSVVYCSTCNFEISRSNITVNAKGHDYVNHDAKEATCLNIGWDAYQTCSRCDYTSYNQISALGHDYISHLAKEATCTSIGWNEYDTCSRCTYSTYAEIEKLGHDYVHHDAKTKTCMDIGWKAYDTCSRCDYTTYVEIPASHNPKSAVTENKVDSKCNEEGAYQSVVYCNDCNKELSRTNHVIPQSHKMSGGICTLCGGQESSSGLTFTLNSDGKSYTLTDIGSCTSKNIVIGVYNNLSVTSLGSYAFYGCSSLLSITIPESVTSIGERAFCDCSSLTGITIPESVTSIGSYAFYGCSSLASVTFGENSQLTTIGSSAFSGCLSLTSITIPESVTSIGNHAFNGCSSLESVTIPESVTSIGSSAFYNCKGLTSITIPDSVTSIGNYAFYGCSCLGSITIPDGVTSIGSYAFYGCTSLTSITIPDGVTSIGDRAFSGCSSLTSITIPESVTSIGGCAFSDCSSLCSITISERVTSIGYQAFYGCYKLVEVINHSSLEIVAGDGTHGYVAYYAKEVHTGESKIQSQNGYLFYTYNDIHYLLCYTGEKKELLLPDSYLGEAYEIYDYAFYSCSSLTSVTFGENSQLTSIGSYAFEWCSSLTSITIPESVTSIGYDAFYGCSSLTSITIPESVTSIGGSAFYGCSSLVYNEYDNAYYLGNDSNPYLWLIKAKSENITSCNIHTATKGVYSSAFYGCSSLKSIKVSEGNIVYHSSGNCLIKTDSKTLVLGCMNSVIPSDGSVTSIGSYAFEDCDSLTSITIPGSVTSIGGSAFYSCSSLTSISIPSSVTSIGSYAFAYCLSLKSITIPESVTSIGDRAFGDCSSLSSVTFGENSQLTSIGSYAFEDCDSLTSITIPESVTSIGSYAFYCCSSLTSITIPDGVTRIGSYAFAYCSSLKSIKFRGTSSQWSAIWKGSYWNSSIGRYTITYNYTGN